MMKQSLTTSQGYGTMMGRRIAVRVAFGRLSSSIRPVLSNNINNFCLDAFSLSRASPFPRSLSSSASTELSDLLGRELAEEEESSSLAMPEELSDLKQQLSQDWNIVDDENSGTVKMISKGSSTKVAVVFHCQDTLEGAFDDADVLDDEGGDDEPSPAIRFTLTVSRAGKTMVLNCLSEEASAVVESVAVTMDDVESIHSTGRISDQLYQVSRVNEELICVCVLSQFTNNSSGRAPSFPSWMWRFRMPFMPMFKQSVGLIQTLQPLSRCTRTTRNKCSMFVG